MPPQPHRQALETGYVDVEAGSLDEALGMLDAAKKQAKPLSVALLGNIVDVLQTLLDRGIHPDALTDQTSAHRPRNGYLPAGLERGRVGRSPRERSVRHQRSRQEVEWPSMSSICCASRPWACGVRLRQHIRQVALDEGLARAFDIPGFVPEYIRPLFCRGIGPFRWAALSGDPQDIYKTDAKVKELIPDDPHLHRWLDMPERESNSRGCRRGSAGSASGSVIVWGWHSTKWLRAANSRRRSSSAAIIWTQDRWPARTARRRP